METKINAILIIQILGKPAEYITQALHQISQKIANEKNVVIIEKRIAPCKIEENGLFSSFIEIGIELQDFTTLTKIVFDYMPSHIEITSPEQMIVKNPDLNNLFNDLVRKLYQYDQVAKVSLIERDILIRKIKSLQESNPDIKEEKEEKKSKKV